MNRCEWFRKAGWGIFLHFLASPPGSAAQAEMSVDDWNRQADSVDVGALAKQVAAAGARYCFITIGQNSGFYLAPNQTYDQLVGRTPGRCSERDLADDLQTALAHEGIPLMVYLPSHAPATDRQAVENLACTPSWDASAWQLRPGTYLRKVDVDQRLSLFQRNWEAVIREWSLRWGDNVKGWWFDGCYFADRMYRHNDTPNFYSFADAARAGNPSSIVAFNGGVLPQIASLTPAEDYTAGEITDYFPLGGDDSGLVNGTQLHILTYLGDSWCRGDQPRFSPELTAEITRRIIQRNGVISWDTPISADGKIPESFIDTLKQINHKND
ncbi:MAG: hypothetical protein WCV67_20885 [Victivallaceae bacterium]